MADLLEVVRQLSDVTKVSNRNGGEHHGPCPKCGGVDRFVVSPGIGAHGLFWCRQCGRKGDAIQFLRDFRGMSFPEAKATLGLDTSPPTTTQVIKRRAERTALKKVKAKYQAWKADKLDLLTAEFRALSDVRDMAAIAYRQAQRRPQLYSSGDVDYWESQLAQAYHRLRELEYSLDLLTYPQNEEARFGWWREEVQGG